MKVRHCKYQGCKKLIPFDESYCHAHELLMASKAIDKEIEQKRLESISQGYRASERHTRYSNSSRSDELGHSFYQTSQWSRLSARVKVRDLYTDSVNGLVYGKGELVVDHIIPRLVDESKALDENNLWLLNRQHHNKKTAIEQRMTDEQLKMMTKADWVKLLK